MRIKLLGNVFLIMVCAQQVNAQDLTNLRGTKPVSFGGGINIQTGFYAINGAKSRQPGFTYILNGTPTLTVLGVSLPFSFTFGNYQRDFRQPFNQFGVSPTYKWLTVHAGYRNISFSQFAMAGYTIVGGGIELKPKNFRFALLHGRSQKAVKDDTSKSIESNLNDINYPAYKRMLTAIKIGYGGVNNFIDLHILRGKDDSTSLPFRPTTTQVMPAKNQVFGASSKLSFFKKKLVWQGEGAISAFTRDIAFETVDAGNGIVNRFIKANITTQVYSALETQLQYNTAKYGLGVKFRKIAPDYRSMGAYFFQTDNQQLLANFKLNLAKNKLRLSGSAGQQKDNLQNKKVATTKRSIYNGVISFSPNSKFGVDATIANFGTSQRAGKRNLSDTAVINQINNAVTIAPRYILANEKRVTSYQGIFGRQALDDKNRFTANLTKVQMLFANLVFMRSNTLTNFSYNAGLNYNTSKNIVGTIGLAGILGGIAKTWKDGKYSMDANTNFNLSTFNDDYNGITANLQYGASMKAGKKHRFSLMANALLNRSKNIEAGNSFEEYSVRLNYGFTL